MSGKRAFSPSEILLLALLLATPLGVSLYMIPRAGLYAVVAALLWGVPAGGLIVAAMRRGRVGK